MHLGIDIDTHTARAAYLDDQGQPQQIFLPDGGVLPALVRQTMHGLVVGQRAAQAIAGNGETTVSGCVRLMGQAGRLPAQLVDRLPYAVRVVEGETVCNLLYAEVAISHIYARLARALVELAEQQLATSIGRVVLTIPARAEDRFRVQARTAVEEQGLTVSRLINQPTAALLAADLPARTRYVAVVHCGGGSIDVSLAERAEDDIRILATAGDLLLGGDDFAWQVAESLNQRFQRVAQVDVFAADRSGAAAWGLRTAAEKVLQRLSLAPEMTLAIDHGGGFGRDLVTVIRQGHIVDWLAPLLADVTALCRQALTNSGLTPAKIETILLTGDWAYLPWLRQTIADAFNQPVARLQAADGSALPVYGAALAGAAGRGTIWDVTPYPLGINCYYGRTELFSPIIRANTPIPTPPVSAPNAFTESYQTRKRDQTEVQLDILQYRGLVDPDPTGPSPVKPKQCERLGSWTFAGLRPKKGQHADLTVTFSIDRDGILHLSATETATGHQLTAQVDRGIG